MPTNPANVPLPSPGRPGAAPPVPSHKNHIRRVHDIVSRVDGLPDADTRALVEELMNAVMQLHGSGLRRMLEIASKSPDERLPNELTGDATLRSLLLIHDLHPDSLEERMGQALAKVLPYIRSHGGDVEVISIEDGVARLRLKGTCQTCPSSAVTLDLAVRAAIEEFCPDLVSFEVVPFPADPAVTPPAERLVCVGEAALAPV